MNKGGINPSTIRIMVGLPHMRKGALLRCARALGQPVLISANGLSRWKRRQGVREWAGWSSRLLANASGLASLSLDSAGYSAMAAYGGFPWSARAYARLAASHPFQWWASLDYCVEQEVARDRDEVLDRISRTVRANIECRMLGEDHGIGPTFLPVLQGRSPADYERCAELLADTIGRARFIGVGSMCRRPVHGGEGLVAVVDHLDRVLPPGKRLHLFGVKGEAIAYLKAYAHRVASIDSQAYGVSARIDARRRRCVKSDGLVAEHMVRWVRRQQARLAAGPRHMPIAPATPSACLDADPWQAAIAAARQEIRMLIESGDLDHDDVTLPWVEQWAADLHDAVGPGAGG